MAINFPDSPSVNDTVTQGDLTWIWDGTVWKLTVATALAPAGSDHQVQFNDNSSFGADANFTYDGDAVVISSNHLSYGESSPTWPVEFATDDDLTSFTGTGKGGVCITNSQYDDGDFTSLDFGYTGSDNPVGRIALKVTGSGSELHFGTSNNYSNGVTNGSVVITSAGYLQVGDGTDSSLDANIDWPLRFNFSSYTGGIGGGGSGDGMWIGHNSSSRAIIFTPDETERVRISGASGYFYVGTTGGDDFPGTDGFLSVKAGNRVGAAFYRESTTSTHDLIYGLSNYSATGTKHFQVENDGDVDNTNNSYGSLSDERLKENIVNPRDYYEDLRRLEVKNFNLCKAVKVDYDTDENGEIDYSTKTVSLVDTHADSRKKMLGLIAQPTEAVMPGLVKTDEEGYKHIRYSVLVPMLLQMCQKLADKVEALESA